MWAESEVWYCTTSSSGARTCDSDAASAICHEDAVLVPPPQKRETRTLPVFALSHRLVGWPNNDANSARDRAVAAAMDSARAIIKIETPNLNDDRAKLAIRDAVSRGVEARIILSLGFNDSTESLPGQGGTNEANVDELLDWARKQFGNDRGCELVRFRWYSRDGVSPVDGHADDHGVGASHTKYMSVDGQLTIVGSANMDTQSWNHSGEADVAIDSRDVAADFDSHVFDADWSRAIAVARCAP
jgi:phosphatidylserine/phosphatidylglycerophosphate/cardiolipin synthase-like enzyme